MQFSCDSCKAALQIADEKVRGKRLVVRCKRCGAKITISDPSLGALGPAVAPRPAARPAQAAPPAAEKPSADEHDSDTESTRAMDSDLLEKALQASKRDEPAASGAAQQPARPPAAEPAPPPRDPPVWFAMLNGKQTGPLSRAELGLKTAQGALGPRTYLWKDGMAAWTRAKDVAEVAAMFGPPPAPEPAAIEPRAHAPAAAIDPRAHAPAAAIDPRPHAPAAAIDPRPRAPAAAIDQHAPAAAIDPRPHAPAKSQAAAPLGGDDEPTAADPLRARQQSVASDLFSGAQPAASAVDLARWASSELGKQKPTGPELPKVPAPAAQFEERHSDLFAEATAHKSRLPLVMAIVVAVLAAVVAAVVFFSSPSAPPPGSEPAKPAAQAEAPKPPPAKPQPLGGTGDTSVTALAAKPEAAQAPAAPETPAASEAPGSETKPSSSRKERAQRRLSAEEKAQLQSLENERGIGTHGPSSEEAAQAPAVEKADSGLTADDVRKKLDQNKGALQGCIDQALRREPNLRVGKIHIATTIAPSGSVTAAKIDKRTVDESPLGSCLKRATRRIVFPSFAGDAFDVDIPIVVTAGE